jgi:hypothetical protein
VSTEPSPDQVVDQSLVRDLAKKLLGGPRRRNFRCCGQPTNVTSPIPRKYCRPQQEVLGLGGEAVVALLTPIVLSVATDVLTEFSH